MGRRRRNTRHAQNRKKKIVIKDKKVFVRSISILILAIVIFSIIIVARHDIKTSLVSLVSSNEASTEDSEDNKEEQEEEKKAKENATFTMAVTGDIMCHNTQYKDAYDASTDTYDFSYVFEDVKRYIQTADIAVGNLETTFAGAEVGYSSYPTLILLRLWLII